MKTLTKKQIEWCKKYLSHGLWEVIDGLVNVRGDVNLTNMKFKNFPVKFGKVSGNFSCGNCTSLISLEGAPLEVGGNFVCSGCTSLTSLEGSPLKVKKFFSCAYSTSLISLKGVTQKLNKTFWCSGCASLASLEGAPLKMKENLWCVNCDSLDFYHKEIADEYNEGNLDWTTAYKLIHRPKLAKAHSLGLI